MSFHDVRLKERAEIKEEVLRPSSNWRRKEEQGEETLRKPSSR